MLHEHQRALQKYSVMKRQMMSATVQPKEQVSVEQLESRIVQVHMIRTIRELCASFFFFQMAFSSLNQTIPGQILHVICRSAYSVTF